MRLINLDDRKTQGHEGVIKHGDFQDQFNGREHYNIRNIEARIQSKLCHLMELLPSFLPFFPSFLHQRCIEKFLFFFHFSVQFSSVVQSCLTLCDTINCSTPGLPVHHQLPEFTQTHVHQVGDATQPSHPLSSPSPPAPSPSQHQGLFQ